MRSSPILIASIVAALANASAAEELRLPYEEAGLPEAAAAAVLLDRFAFGARPGDVERAVAMGLPRWFEQQLAGALPEPALAERLSHYEALGMTDAELVARYPNSSQLSAHVRRFFPGLIPGRDEPVLDFSVVTAKLDAFRSERGILTQDVELRQQVLGQKIDRAVLAENQLREVVTDFWQNHFFTSPTNFNARGWFLSFERDALRPNALGSFDALLKATARHPAMLQYYLNTASAATLRPEQTTLAAVLARYPGGAEHAAELRAAVDGEVAAVEREDDLVLARQFWAPTGANEAHAYSLLAFQTLGTSAAFTRADVADVARAFTGWSTAPVGPSPQWYEQGFSAAYSAGFVRDGSFLFRADRHDALPKRILGHDFPAGGGLDEGERVLALLAAHPATARHIAYKLAVRFVGDAPPDTIVDRLATEFTVRGGDIAAVLRALVSSQEFWKAASERGKIKTPFEFAVSAIRATGARVDDAPAVAARIAALGQPLYAFLEPTGYPDKGEYWLDSAALLARVEFARALAANRVAGVEAVDAAVDAPLGALAHRVLPGRSVEALVERLAAADVGIDPAAHLALLLASPEFQLR